MSLRPCCTDTACTECGGSGLAKQKTGFHPDKLVEIAKLFPGMTHETVLGAAPATIPDVIVNSDLIASILNQLTTSACVGFTFAECLDMMFAGLGIVVAFSAFFFYWLGRAVGNQLQGLPNTTTLVDGGTAPGQVIQGLGAAGACLEEFMPSTDPSAVNDPERSAAASDAAPRIPLVVTAFVAIVADNDNDTETAVLQGLLPRADGTRGLTVMAAVDADPLQVADGSYVVEPSSGAIDHMIEIVDAVKVIAFDPASMTGQLANGLTLTWKVAPVVGQYAYRWRNHWGTSGSPKCDIPGTIWTSRAFVLASQFKYLLRIDETAAKAAFKAAA